MRSGIFEPSLLWPCSRASGLETCKRGTPPAQCWRWISNSPLRGGLGHCPVALVNGGGLALSGPSTPTILGGVGRRMLAHLVLYPAKGHLPLLLDTWHHTRPSDFRGWVGGVSIILFTYPCSPSPNRRPLRGRGCRRPSLRLCRYFIRVFSSCV